MNDPLPPPGPPFAVGDEVAFFPAEVATGEDPGWLRWDYAVIDDVNEAAHSFGFHFVPGPAGRPPQGMENIVRQPPTYDQWRAAFERLSSQGQDPESDPAVHDLWVRVLAEHPLHGGQKR